MSKKYFYTNTLLILVSDIFFVAFSWYVSYLLRFNFSIPEYASISILTDLPLVIVIKIFVFHFFKLYQGMWRYTSIVDMGNIFMASCLSTLLIAFMVLFSHGVTGFPRSVFIIDWCNTLLLISGFRVGIRLYYGYGVGNKSDRSFRLSLFHNNHQGRNLLIIGAGNCGEKIAREIRDNPNLGYRLVGFIDDNPLRSNLQIHGIPVVGNTHEIKSLVKKMGVAELLIAISATSYNKMRTIVKRCDASGIPYKTVPSMSELINGNVSVKTIRDVAYKDLLGREPVSLDEERIEDFLEGSRVLVTGAGGSIGSELCRQICRFRPELVVLFERAESPLYDMELELKRKFPLVEVVPMLADICDHPQLSSVFKTYKPQVIFHAAAYKHVPLLELQPWKAVKNNILGTRNIIEISKEFSVKRFVFVSTDKAVRPTNVMGTSKRVSELLVHGQNGCELSDKKFMAVRFGNVVGSAGSVVPLFRRQIAKGGPVTVTHPDVTRYFMTIPEACQLILQAGSMGTGGETFVLDMGTPVKINDMARDLIRLSGYEPGTDIEIEYIGLRPGEKLYEELITEGEGIKQTEHEKIMVLRGQSCNQAELNRYIDELLRLADEYDGEEIRTKLREIVPEYCPEMGKQIVGDGKNNGNGKSRLTFIDRRSEKRLYPINGSVVVPNSDLSKECKIVDVGKNGLSFYYNGRKDLMGAVADLTVKIVDNGFHIANIPCKVVSQASAADDYMSDSNDIKRLGVQFGVLTRDQKDQIEYYMKQYTAPFGNEKALIPADPSQQQAPMPNLDPSLLS